MLRSLYVVGMTLFLIAGFQAATACGRHHTDTSARSDGRSAQLDSRTIAHPDWVQVSGHIEETRTITPQGQPAQLLAVLKPVEGGRVIVDLGPVDNLGSVQLQEREYLHVRGNPAQSGQHPMIIAGEIIADGKVIPITRPAEVARSSNAQDAVEEQTRSPAAPPTPGGR